MGLDCFYDLREVQQVGAWRGEMTTATTATISLRERALAAVVDTGETERAGRLAELNATAYRMKACAAILQWLGLTVAPEDWRPEPEDWRLLVTVDGVTLSYREHYDEISLVYGEPCAACHEYSVRDVSSLYWLGVALTQAAPEHYCLKQPVNYVEPEERRTLALEAIAVSLADIVRHLCTTQAGD